jgi:hypothetical protein
MSTMSHGDGVPTTADEHDWFDVFSITEIWASLAISVMWLAVLFSSIYGSTIVSNWGQSTVPSGIVVAFFATIASWGVAKHGLGSHRPTK